MAIQLDTEQPDSEQMPREPPGSEPTPRPNWAIWSVGALLVASLGLLVPIIAPPPDADTEFCGEFRELFDGRGYVDNCDSRAFWRLAEHPERIIKIRDHPRQSRPLFIGIGAAARTVARPFVALSGTDDPTTPARMGYLAVNLILLAVAVGLAGRLLRGVDTSWLIVAGVAVVLVFNNVIKAFIWTAHTQIFNILLPIVLLAVVARQINPASSQRWRFLMAFLLGVMSLAYGSFLVGLPLLLIAAEVARRRSSEPLSTHHLLREAAVSAVFLAPILLWMGYASVAAPGGFYSHETSRHRQFVWIFDHAAEGSGELWSQTAENTRVFFNTLNSFEIAPFILLFAAALWSFVARRRAGTPSTRDVDLQIGALWAAGALFLFSWLLGFYAQRVSFSVVPALLIFIALEARARWKDSPLIPGAALLVAAAIWAVPHFVQAGPYM